MADLDTYLRRNGLNDERITLAKNNFSFFDQFIQSKGMNYASLSIEATTNALEQLDQNLVDFDLLLVLIFTLRQTGRNDIVAWVIDQLEGGGVLENMVKKAMLELGEEKMTPLLEGFSYPTFLSSAAEKAKAATELVDRLQMVYDEEDLRLFLTDNFHEIPSSPFQWLRDLFVETGDIDHVAEASFQRFVDKLKECRDNHTLFFSQEITDEVVDWVLKEGDIETGVRIGKHILVSKVPFKAKEYLAEKDPVKRRFYYCHCPFVRPSILAGEKGVPDIFCHCSGGFSKVRWDVIFNQETEVEVVQTVYGGGDKCTFKITIPDDYQSS